MRTSAKFWESLKGPFGLVCSTRTNSFKTIFRIFAADLQLQPFAFHFVMNPDQTPKLLRLKRYESPPEGYFTSFLEEFHRRQREDVLKRSSRSLFLER